MHITIDNYEQYFLDHAEGNLSPELERELSEFLDANPGLKLLLDDFDLTPLQPQEIHNDDLKLNLKKYIHPTDHIDDANINDWLIREVECQLGEDEKNELEDFLDHNPAYNHDRKLFALTRLVPDQTVVYAKKNELKKRAVLIPVHPIYWSLAAAAAIVLLFLGIRYFQQDIEDGSSPLRQAVADISNAHVESLPVQEPITKAQLKGTLSPGTLSLIIRTASFRLEPTGTKAIEIVHIDDPVINNFASFNLLPVQFEEEKEKSRIGKVFSNMLAKAKNNIGRNTGMDNIKVPDFNLWAIAKAGIDGYNSIADRDLELYVHRNDEGNVSSYALIEQDRLLMEKNRNEN